MFQVGTHEDQAAGAALAFGGGDAGLSAPNLFLQVVALASLGILKLFFSSLLAPGSGPLGGPEVAQVLLVAA